MVGDRDWKVKRCNRFDDKGYPRVTFEGAGIGCPRHAPQCKFAHPEDPEWEDLPPARPPPAYIAPRQTMPRRSPSPDRERHRARDRSRERRNSRRSRSPARRRRSRTRSRTPPSHRSFSPRSSVRSYSPHRRTPPPRSRTDDRPLRDARTRTSSDMSFASPYTATTGRDRERTASTVTDLAGPSTSRQTRDAPRQRMEIDPIDTTKPVEGPAPPPPAGPPPDEPPPPRPTGFTSTFAPVAPVDGGSRIESSTKAKEDAWTERIRLLADAVVERVKESQLDEEIQKQQQLVQSPHFASLSDDEKQKHLVILSTTRTRFEEQKQKNAVYVSKLVDQAFWPVLAPFDVKTYEEGRANMSQTIGDLKEYIAEAQGSMSRAGLLKPSQKLSGIPDPSTSTSTSEDTGSRPLKRRRTDPLEDGEMDVDAPEVASTKVPAAIQAALDLIEEKFASLRDRLEDLGNEQNIHHETILAEFECELENAIDNIVRDEDAIRERVAQIRARGLDSMSDAMKTIVGGAQELMGGIETDIRDMSKEVAELIERTKMLEQKTEQLEKDSEASKEHVERLQKDYDAQKSTNLRIQNELRALSAMLSAALAQPPPQLQLPPTEFLVQSIEKPISALIRAKAYPLLQDLQKSIQEVLTLRGEEITKQVMPRLKECLWVAEFVISWIQKVDKEGWEATIRSKAAAARVPIPQAMGPPPLPSSVTAQ